MKGDFSKWYFDRNNNFNGVLHQQGRVLLDSDWNDQTRINIEWQDQAGQDIIGPEVAAVPVSEKDSFKVIEASTAIHIMKPIINPGRIAANKVHLKIIPGRLWVNGFLVTLPGKDSVERVATYLKQPVQKFPSEDTRDMIVLEVWRDSINGFQQPNLLIESALGGPDTTERIHTEMAFRLLRLEDGDTCYNVADKLKDDFGKKGKLTVSLKTPSPISWNCPKVISPTSGDCPLIDDGGYTGLEHDLYRIEIADVDDTSEPMFKWSQFNGGLVGTGTKLDTEPNKIKIIDNLQAILSSGLDNFYLEVIKYDDLLGYWKVIYGAKTSLQDGVLSLEDPLFPENKPISAIIPNLTEKFFFRLWNDVEKISDYQLSEPKDLQYGIQLKFETGGSLVPQDFWTFSVRAGDTNNGSTLIDKQPPQGIRYYRVPLAIVKWRNDKTVANITDCRDAFMSLTDLTNLCKKKKNDCTLIAVPGDDWEKIFDQIEDNQDAKICFQIGTYVINNPIVLENKGHLRISGCGGGTRIIGPKSETVFKFVSCKSVVVKDLYAEAGTTGFGKENLKNQNGVLTFCACPKITVENADLKCAAGAERAACCINVRDALQYKRHEGKNPKLVPVESVRIYNCDLSVGHQQSGIILVNTRKVFVENNIIQVYALPARLPLKVLLENKRHRSAVRSLMIHSSHLTEPKANETDVFSADDTAKIKAGERSVWFKTDRSLVSAWQEWIKISQPKGIQNNRDMLFHMIKIADRVLLNEGILKASDKSFAGFKNWYGKLLEESVAVGSQGIVAGGTTAQEILIINNRITGFMQGIHTGTSHTGVTSKTLHDSSGIVNIMGNNIEILLSPIATRERHGIFVGNCFSLTIQNNFVSVQRYSLTKSLDIDGIRVYGHIGRMMIISQNYIVNASTGILFAVMNSERELIGKQQWIISSNIALYSKNVVVVNGKLANVSNKVRQEFNCD